MLYLRAQQRHIMSEVRRGAALVSDTVKSSTYHDMLADRRDTAYPSMETISQQAGIERVRIFNKEGRVTFSTDGPRPAPSSTRRPRPATSATKPAGRSSG